MTLLMLKKLIVKFLGDTIKNYKIIGIKRFAVSNNSEIYIEVPCVILDPNDERRNKILIMYKNNIIISTINKYLNFTRLDNRCISVNLNSPEFGEQLAKAIKMKMNIDGRCIKCGQYNESFVIDDKCSKCGHKKSTLSSILDEIHHYVDRKLYNQIKRLFFKIELLTKSSYKKFKYDVHYNKDKLIIIIYRNKNILTRNILYFEWDNNTISIDKRRGIMDCLIPMNRNIFPISLKKSMNLFQYEAKVALEWVTTNVRSDHV